MKYLVGMSGGIDSSVSAVKLKKEGHDVVGVHMILWSEDIHYNKCCNTADMMFAREVARRHDIPFYTVDFRDVFKQKIVDEQYLGKYEEGLTPNPCVSCNRYIRFGALLDTALRLGLEKICTGHYARVEDGDGDYRLKAGVDKSKDQSYFLHRLTQEQLDKIYFPLGEMTKDEVKKLAKKWKLINLNRKKLESQDLCFLPEDTPEPFLRRNLYPKYWQEGDIVTSRKKLLGRHRGLPFYTIGQRKGLDIGGLEEPLYVIGKDEENNQIIVGTEEQGWSKNIYVKNLNLIPEKLEKGKKYTYKIRYAGKGIPGKIKLEGESSSDEYGELWSGKITLDEKIKGITPGQFVVIYDGDYCLGGGEISH